MTATVLFERLRKLKPVPAEIDDTILLDWLNQVEGQILHEIFLLSLSEITPYSATPTEALAAPYPYDGIYLLWMEAQVDFANGEYERYTNTMQRYNTAWNDLARHIAKCIRPVYGRAVEQGYYLSAYGIAKAHGYTGTEAEWLASLKGAAGEPGKDGKPFTWRGAWDASTSYAKLDAVEHNGSCYVWTDEEASTAGDEPGVDELWELCAAKGDKGAPGSNATDEQVAVAVNSYLTAHPEATTTVQDGAITDAKLSDDLYKQVMGDARHNLTEVEVTLIPGKLTINASNAWEATNFDGTEYTTVTAFHTPLTATPRYIKVVNKTNDKTIELRGGGYNRFRFANGADEAADGFATTDGSRNLRFFNNLSVAPADTLLYDLQEFGRKGCEYFQFIVTGKNISGKYTDAQFTEKMRESVEVYYVYDSYIPTYNLPDNSGEFLMDLPIKYVAQGINDTSSTRVYAVAPYYPDTTYNVRGGYYDNGLVNTLSVVYLLDDKIFDGRDNGLEFNSGACGNVPLIRGMSTTQYDTSVNAGRNDAYAWAYHKTPPETELVGPKYIGIRFLYLNQDENVDMGKEYYNSIFDSWNDEGPKNRYITRFNKQVPRSLYAQLAFPNPNYHDDGSKYYAMLTSASKSPLVGASWVLFGDSLTDNYGGHDLTGDYFATKIAREFNMSFDNRAKSGSNIYRGGSGNYTSVSGMIKLDEFVAEIEAGTTEQPDYITIAFGTNSFTAQLGTNEDTSATDTSVYGATKRFIEVLREKCPKSVFGFVLSPKQNWGSSDPNNLRAVDAARTAIKAVCDEYGVPYIDMSTQSGITATMLPDGIHISNDQSQNLYYHAMRRFMIGL